VVFFTLRGSRAVTRPVRRLADAAERIAGGDLDAVVNVETNDELGHLSRTFNDMVPKLKDRLQLRESMSLAMEVQQSLLPSAPPQVDGLDVAGESIYCDETGGDYYDFLDVSPLGATRLAVAVGDVTGHGIAAALLMTAGRALLRSNAERVDSIAELLGAINKHLTADTPAGRFMTMFCAVIDSKQRHMRWASAGHDSPLIYLPASGDIHEFDDGGIPLGIEAEWRYEEFDYRGLEPGTVIVIGTDGVWESANAQGELYGKERLRELIRLHAADSAEVISDAITRSIAEFRGSEPQRDDVTLVVVKLVS
jgi:sigma-B regulation protein RsbU (phosphoserine phosphatase)